MAITRHYDTELILLERLAHLLLLFEFLPQHRFKGTQNLLFVLLLQHVSKFCDLLTLLRTTDKLFAHYGELDPLSFYITRKYLLYRIVELVDHELLIFS
jgi:hypothetical protein